MLDRVRRYFSPFEVMRDVSRGTYLERAAAFRHNLRHRGCLTTYIQRWLVSGVIAYLLCSFFDAMTPHESRALTVPVVLSASVAIIASLSLLAVFVLSYAYAALSYYAAHPDE
ncbi:MAG TPA: hypothetical protein VFS52_14035 [Steroidobacteraceae bacterium]|nr:hypothetical protein [Steroidobacteraceae bacterium]